MQNLPVEYEECDVMKLLEVFPNIVAVRMRRERGTGRSLGYAFVDFASGAADEALEGCPWGLDQMRCFSVYFLKASGDV